MQFQQQEINGAEKTTPHPWQVDGGGHLPKSQQVIPQIK
jgi:hypothetical protein